MEAVIKVENLSKIYVIAKNRSSYKTFREAMRDALSYPLRKLSSSFQENSGEAIDKKEIWALEDISFEVRSGEVMGVIGRNGAGKSTLLKILSKITQPTKGRAKICGRVGSLLEVGTGFHPELTGRENIFLNGAILGMKHGEIKQRFDEIVAFAETEKFLDTPVKHYSTGMYLRLAFAVAAHLETEVLLVDEVLAVGDASFQRKCLNKMQNIGQRGRTVLFVSHNMAAIRNLCSRVVLLDRGGIQYQGTPVDVVQHYLNGVAHKVSTKLWEDKDRPGNQSFRLNAINLKNTVGEEISAVNISEEARIEIKYELFRDGGRAQFSLVLFDADGNCVFGSLSNTEPNYYGKPMPAGNYRSYCNIYGNLLNAGRYHVSIIGGSAHWSDSFTVDHVISFEAVDDGVLKGDYLGGYGGVIRPKLKWETMPC